MLQLSHFFVIPLEIILYLIKVWAEIKENLKNIECLTQSTKAAVFNHMQTRKFSTTASHLF